MVNNGSYREGPGEASAPAGPLGDRADPPDLVHFASTLVAVILRQRRVAAGWWTCDAAAIARAAGLVRTAEVWRLCGVDLPWLEVVKIALWLVPAMLVAGPAALAVVG